MTIVQLQQNHSFYLSASYNKKVRIKILFIFKICVFSVSQILLYLRSLCSNAEDYVRKKNVLVTIAQVEEKVISLKGLELLYMVEGGGSEGLQKVVGFN